MLAAIIRSGRFLLQIVSIRIKQHLFNLQLHSHCPNVPKATTDHRLHNALPSLHSHCFSPRNTRTHYRTCPVQLLCFAVPTQRILVRVQVAATLSVQPCPSTDICVRRVCCGCNQTNLPKMTTPERCPIDGHYKCVYCRKF